MRLLTISLLSSVLFTLSALATGGRLGTSCFGRGCFPPRQYDVPVSKHRYRGTVVLPHDPMGWWHKVAEAPMKNNNQEVILLRHGIAEEGELTVDLGSAEIAAAIAESRKWKTAAHFGPPPRPGLQENSRASLRVMYKKPEAMKIKKEQYFWQTESEATDIAAPGLPARSYYGGGMRPTRLDHGY